MPPLRLIKGSRACYINHNLIMKYHLNEWLQPCWLRTVHSVQQNLNKIVKGPFRVSTVTLYVLTLQACVCVLVNRPSPCVVRKSSGPHKESKGHGNRLSAGPRNQPRPLPRVTNGDKGKPQKGKEKRENPSKPKEDRVRTCGSISYFCLLFEQGLLCHKVLAFTIFTQRIRCLSLY